MRVLLIAVGSRGDVQPLVALGVGLRGAGHEVTVASTPDFAGLATEHGLGFEALGSSAAELMDSELGRTWLGHSSHNRSSSCIASARSSGPGPSRWPTTSRRSSGATT